MKKLLGALAMAFFVATAAFADISFGAWLSVFSAPLAYDGNDFTSVMTNPWGWNVKPAVLNVNGRTEDNKAGFTMIIAGKPTESTDRRDVAADNAMYIWVQPWDFIRFNIGSYDHETLKGGASFGSMSWVNVHNYLDDDDQVTFRKNQKTGLMVELFPTEDLYIYGVLPMAVNNAYASDAITGPLALRKSAYRMFEEAELAAGYTIPDIGKVKLGWFGFKHGNGHMSDNRVHDTKGDEYKYFGDIEFAFDLTSIDKLFLSLGGRVSIAESDFMDLVDYTVNDVILNKGKYFDIAKAAVSASYQVTDAFKVAGNVDVHFLREGKDQPSYDPAISFGVGVDYAINESVEVTADFRGLFVDDKIDEDPTFSFMVGLTYHVNSNSLIGIGFQGATNGCGFAQNGSGRWDSKDKNFTFMVPIRLGVWFF